MEHLWYSFSRNGDFLQLAVVFMCNWNFSWPLADDWLSHIVTSDPVLHLHQPLPVYLNIPHSPLVISRTWPRSPFSSLQLPFRHFPLCNCHHSSSLVFFPSPSLCVFLLLSSPDLQGFGLFDNCVRKSGLGSFAYVVLSRVVLGVLVRFPPSPPARSLVMWFVTLTPSPPANCVDTFSFPLSSPKSHWRSANNPAVPQFYSDTLLADSSKCSL